MKHEHTPELREQRHYSPNVIAMDAWVCCECEAFLGEHKIGRRVENQQAW